MGRDYVLLIFCLATSLNLSFFFFGYSMVFFLCAIFVTPCFYHLSYETKTTLKCVFGLKTLGICHVHICDVMAVIT